MGNFSIVGIKGDTSGVSRIHEMGISKRTYPWNIPQTQNHQFMKEFLSFGLNPVLCLFLFRDSFIFTNKIQIDSNSLDLFSW